MAVGSRKWLASQSILGIVGLPQLFVKRNADGSIQLAMAKVVDDMLSVGPKKTLDRFHSDIAKRLHIGRYIVDQQLIFNGLRINKNQNGCVQYDMEECMQSISPLQLTEERRKQQPSRCTSTELTDFLNLTGKLNWLGHGALPQAAFAASHLQQSIGRLSVSHLITANKVLAELKSLTPKAVLLQPSDLRDPCYLAFSDASQGSTSYGQTSYISGLYLPAEGTKIFRALDWTSSKQARVAFTSIGAEILAAATSTGRGSLMAERHKYIYGSSVPFSFVLSVDSNGLYSTITTLHEKHNYRLRPTVSGIRDSFENEEISIMQWIPGK